MKVGCELFRRVSKKVLSSFLYQGKAKDIKNHVWFDDVNWQDVYERRSEVRKMQLIFIKMGPTPTSSRLQGFAGSSPPIDREKNVNWLSR